MKNNIFKDNIFKDNILKLLTITAILAISSTANAKTETKNAVAMAKDCAVEVDVNGLVCDFCAQALNKVFRAKDEVADVSVNLDTKKVSIKFKEGKSLKHDEIMKLITDSGYDVVGMKHKACGK